MSAPGHSRLVDDQRLGSALRALRLRRRLRQRDVARAARVSVATVSRAERGLADDLSLAALRRIAGVLGIRLELLPRSRGADLDRLLNARHAALSEEVVRRLRLAPGWIARPEVSFAVYGERGVIDVVAWHASSASLLVVEVKTAIVDVGELLGTLDRKRRLARAAVEPFGWRPRTTSTWLVVAESMTNRRRVAAHRETFDAVLPDDGRRLRRWLGRPAEAVVPVHALSFVTDVRQEGPRSGFAALLRAPTRPGPARHPRSELASRSGAGSLPAARPPDATKHPLNDRL